MLLKDLPVFNHPDVASLAWAIGSPPLLQMNAGKLPVLSEDWYDSQLEKHLEWLQDLDSKPERLTAWLDEDEVKLLGKRFESLLAFWFTQSPFFECLERNVRFTDGNNSTGEVDFIIRDQVTDEVIHLEVACKYYIGEPHNSNRNSWVGPNGHDSLSLKMEKLKKQIGIFRTEQGRDWLRTKKLHLDQSYVLIKGYFFHPYREMMYPVPPVDAHAHYSSGWFVSFRELEVFADEVEQWLVLPKSRWMCPFHFPVDDVILLSGKEMMKVVLSEIELKKKSVLVIQVNREGKLLREVSRGFVVAGNSKF